MAFSADSGLVVLMLLAMLFLLLICHVVGVSFLAVPRQVEVS